MGDSSKLKKIARPRTLSALIEQKKDEETHGRHDDRESEHLDSDEFAKRTKEA